MENQIESTVIRAISQHKQFEEGVVTLDSSLESLGVSSLDAITIVYDIEDVFGVEVPNEALESLKTVEDIIIGISGLLKASTSE
jgi:acyl carrier protein